MLLRLALTGRVARGAAENCLEVACLVGCLVRGFWPFVGRLSRTRGNQRAQVGLQWRAAQRSQHPLL